MVGSLHQSLGELNQINWDCLEILVEGQSKWFVLFHGWAFQRHIEAVSWGGKGRVCKREYWVLSHIRGSLSEKNECKDWEPLDRVGPLCRWSNGSLGLNSICWAFKSVLYEPEHSTNHPCFFSIWITGSAPLTLGLKEYCFGCGNRIFKMNGHGSAYSAFLITFLSAHTEVLALLFFKDKPWCSLEGESIWIWA